jgi:superfamily I DNA/RNA helicase
VNLNEYRIFGPPGCGKTTTLSRIITEVCEKEGSESIIAASFTRSAARELVSRHLPIDDQRIGTLHALCYRSLDRPELINKDDLEAWNGSHPIWPFDKGRTHNLDDLSDDIDGIGKLDGDTLLEEANRLRGMEIPIENWPMRAQAFYEAWKQFKFDTGHIDFTDLIERCVTEKTPIPYRASTFILDEVQDFSPLELTLARHWGSQADRFVLAGDDEQCLYTFKGASPDAFLYPPIPQDRITVLDQSYRVPRAVHASACEWSSKIQNRMVKTYKPRDYDGIVDQLPITYLYVDPLREWLEEWIMRGKTVAILGSCSFFLNHTKHKLREWGFPFHNPYRKHRGDWNPLNVRSGSTSAAQRLLAFLKMKDTQSWWTYADLYDWTAILESKEVFTAGAKTDIRRHAEQFGADLVDPQKLSAWMPGSNIRAACVEGDVGWLCDHTLKSFLSPVLYASEIIRQRGVSAIKASPQIILGTIHSVKGGEADIVILFPDLSPAGMREWATPGDSEDAIRRCFYVGMTRAREELYWAQPSGRSITGYL